MAQRQEYHDAIAWALKIELEQECGVKLLAPGYIHVDGGMPARGTGQPEFSLRTASTTAQPLQSARLNRPVLPPPAPQPEKKPSEPISHKQVTPVMPLKEEPPLAKQKKVRENTMSEAGAKGSSMSRAEYVKQKAASDPVVQEVVRMFKADVKEIKLK
jgi:DNA polymerase-3 subunit gamma/tau